MRIKAILCVAALASVAPSLLSQTPTIQKLSFEIASIKPSPVITGTNTILCHGADAAMPPGSPPGLGRCILGHRSLIDIITWAYDVPYLAITGGPDWIKSERFDIEAKAEDPTQTNREKFQLMLQSLMTERFKMVFHRETREGAGYEMVVAKGGAKLEEPTGKRFPQGIFLSQVNHQITGNSGTMARLATAIGVQLNAVVIDRTGLSGFYDFGVRWSPQPGEPGFNSRADVVGPSLFGAMQEQLGLKLEFKKIPIEMFVIDSAERPTPN